jgi:hypothetical protein
MFLMRRQIVGAANQEQKNEPARSGSRQRFVFAEPFHEELSSSHPAMVEERAVLEAIQAYQPVGS